MVEQRIYYLDINDKVKIFLKGLDKKTQRIITRKIIDLSKHPFNNNTKILGKNKTGDGLFCELKHNEIRIYFKVIGGLIIIDNIKYKGKIIVDDVQSHKTGKGGKQQKYINKKKKKK